MPTGIHYLDGPRLRRCLMAGMQKLIADRDYLNQINVFPVPDGDTGNNLAQTATAAHQALANYTGSGSAAAVLHSMADAALDAAQGNSGALLAQFLQGLATGTPATDRIQPEQLATAFAEAAAYTRGALESPCEGTILTAIDAAAAAAIQNLSMDDFAELLPAMLTAANIALQGTTDQLPELRKAGVVDAGAAGFCAILTGCTEFLLHGSLRDPEPAVTTQETVHVHHEQITDLKYRYCTECMIGGTELEPLRVRHALQSFGNSLVVAGSSERLRIHIHTNDPERIFEFAAEFGEVQKTKADDMIGQARSLSRSNREVAIVTDSAADIPAELISALDIHIVPLRVQFGAASHLDRIGMSAADFRAELESNPAAPGTSQPTQGDLRRMYDFLTTHFTEVISIHLSGAVSGTWQGANNAANNSLHSEKIHLLDSRSVSVGQGLIVKHAAELAAQGIRGAELRALIEKDISSVRSFALVTDLSNAVRSGRIKPAVKRVADWLRLTPVLTSTADGKVGVHGFIPGRRKLVERFARYVCKAVGPSGAWEIAIAHSDTTLADAEQLETLLREQFETVTEAWRTDIGAALGVHSGMEALVVGMRNAS
jgi:DegV family protein with EDD domain